MIFGILTSYILGSFLTWRYLSLSSALITIPSIFLLFTAPDSPTWLFSKGRFDHAYQTLEILHGTQQASTTLRRIQTKTEFELNRQQKNGGFRKRQLDIGMIKSSAVALGIMSFQQLTGYCTILIRNLF